jgi:hypothetical protein
MIIYSACMPAPGVIAGRLPLAGTPLTLPCKKRLGPFWPKLCETRTVSEAGSGAVREVVPRPLVRDSMRLEPRVQAGLIDFDHEVAVVVVWQRRQHGVEVHYPESRLAPQALGRR